ncbi:monovalent cation/H(+) antiporter subunit G [Meridianimarinicoccus aquatilis]|uniref:Monovalent cation/H(+) antiporter subunit G n=1 Tax=Meridianimarinicoccus aquatilis TaxID=2552766 RepID=A0A4R6B1L7_9RHOB|nr:monovalent cation/H(+) antiporter subunit G [Fluviibacterium aquatile]QIE41216.1 monovalent cation/H(+) antiporter subunit G [Rhodobacteraceae bacterium SC52]TDL90557.1 monovalent cation/H(+) antiporter subunit G [Fluviibacterium aquatile]
MIEIIAGLLILGGSGFVLIAGLGVYNLPDALNRMHASTKAGTLGSILVLIATALVFGNGAVTAQAVATIAFLLLTAPISAHMIGRATVQMQRVREEGCDPGQITR